MEKKQQQTEFDWINEIDFEECLDADSRLFYNQCGRELFIAVWTKMLGVSIHFSEKPLWRAKQKYILKYFTGDNHKELALHLGISQDYIYKTLQSAKSEKNKLVSEPDLFLSDFEKRESA